jgi:hypothetical protein
MIILRLVSLTMSSLSAVFLSYAMVYRFYAVQHAKEVPPGMLEGGAGFSLSAPFFFAGVPGLLLGGLALLLLMIAICLNPKPYKSPTLIISGLALIPFFISCIYVARLFLKNLMPQL